MTFVARKRTPGEKALAIVTECEAMLADMRRELIGVVAAEKRAGKKGAPVQLEPPAKDDREFDDEGDE
jgi:hypothetical protein